MSQKAYWQNEKASIYLGDCLQVMETLPGPVNCIITDPPYCSGAVSEAGRASAKGQGLRSENLKRFGWFVGDNMTTGGISWLMREVAVTCRRLIGGAGSFLCFMDWRMVPVLVPAIESAGWRYQNLLVWNKQSMGLGNGFRTQHELIGHFTNGAPEYYSQSFGNVFDCKRITTKEKLHQTEKPTALLESLIRVVSPVDGLVLDPFAGSCSTGVAALGLHRRFIGIEQHEGHIENGVNNLRRASLDPCDKPAGIYTRTTETPLFVASDDLREQNK